LEVVVRGAAVPCADAGSKEPARLCETRKKRATASRFLLSEYKWHIGGYVAATACPRHHSLRISTLLTRLRFAESGMNTFDRQITSAARQLDDVALDEPSMFEAADAMHALLVGRADALMGCTEGSPEEAELSSIADAIEAYEAIRWPEGKIPGGKG
jgi:hypothetical protein